LPGSYARYLAQSGWNLYYDNAGNLVNGIIEYNKNQALFYINKALALDSTNQAAMSALDDLYFMVPGLTYTPPPTIPPTATPLVSATPTFKPTETITPRGYTTSTSWPTETKAPTKSPRPSATSSNTPIPTDAPVTITPLSTEQPKNSNTSMFYAGFFAVFFTGLGIGYFVRRSKKEQ
jgi:hypothetical protein